ncbi:AraC family transcriptional regulator [Novipirellula artificiosorum]|uniref:Xylose operon regulatory protein n=1 Tax=Novipirellula artificiosorum TaxID=2528016 RepID=A0A5C6D888_9BACT|nr:DNA-binding transcriptional regulator [Novipirellula artificiosorum]TWU33383.1 Xylose operon regulatory protein [Novipirellula artificiosorum]
MLQKYRVVLMIETSSSYGRDLLEGIIRFLKTHHNWSVFLEQRDLARKPPAWLLDWKGHGIISRQTTAELAAAAKASGVAVVELTDRGEDFGFPLIRSNDKMVGRMAADHLLSRGFRNFAFCGFDNEGWSSRREEAFIETVKAKPKVKDCAVYRSTWYGDDSRSWEDEQTALVQWLKKLPKPVGVFCCNDGRGQHVLDACARADFSIPEEVAVIGVDNDPLLGQLSDPPLSSVRVDPEEIGFRAATLLTQLMSGGKAESMVNTVPPLGVETRQSTDVMAIDDPSIAAALSYIREHACSDITVQDVMKHCGLSRSTLERQLRKLLGRSPQQEIRHVQIKRARNLLTETDLPMDQIASLCGFDHPEYMHVVFRRETDMTPGQYRRRSKANL